MDPWLAELTIFDKQGNYNYGSYQVIMKVYKNKITLRFQTEEMRIEDMDLQENWFNELLERELRTKDRKSTVIKFRRDTNMSGDIVQYSFSELKKHLEFYKVIVNQNKKNSSQEEEQDKINELKRNHQSEELQKEARKLSRLNDNDITWKLTVPLKSFASILNEWKKVKIYLKILEPNKFPPSLTLCLIKTHTMYYAYISNDTQKSISHNVVASEPTIDKLFETLDKMDTMCIIDTDFPVNSILTTYDISLKYTLKRYKATYIEKLECYPSEGEIALFAKYIFEKD